jgi:hypothetical protein
MLRRLAAAIAVLLGVATVLYGTASSALASPATITPGTLGNDQNGNPLQLHGLGIIKVGKIGESSANTSLIAIPCYTSTNLTNWTFQSDALTRQSSGDLGPNRIVERPKVIYNSSTKQYVMYMHIDDLS